MARSKKVEISDPDEFSLARFGYELRGPITNIIGFSFLLEGTTKGQIDPKSAEYLGYITKSAHAVVRAIDSLLDAFISEQEVTQQPIPQTRDFSGNNSIDNVIDFVLSRERRLGQRSARTEIFRLVSLIKQELNWHALDEAERQRQFRSLSTLFDMHSLLVLEQGHEETSLDRASLAQQVGPSDGNPGLAGQGQAPPIPKKPPRGQLFRKRPRGESAPDFIKRVYGDWLTGEFTKAHLRRLDPDAVTGLNNWERIHGKAEINLPTIVERNDQQLSTLGQRMPEDRKEALRLRSAARRRGGDLKP